MRVGADTLHLVAAALVMMRSAFGRRLTVAAVLQSTLALIVCLQRDLTCLTDPVRAADEDSLLLHLLRMLLLLMLLLGHERMHLAIIVRVKVAVVITVLALLVVSVSDNVDAPLVTWQGSRIR